MRHYDYFSARQFLWKGILALLCMLCRPAAAADYQPMLKDSRIWNYIEVYDNWVYVDSLGNVIDTSDESIDLEEIWHTRVYKPDTISYTYHIDGTEMVGDRLCYKMYRDNNSSYALYYEKDGKVYDWGEEEWVECFDFTLEVGEADPYDPRLSVFAVDTINVGDTHYRRLYFGISDDEGKQYWIEGVGSTEFGPAYYRAKWAISFDLKWRGILSVYDGETCIFERKDFHLPGIGTGIDSVPKADSNAEHHQVRYDLQGRRLSGKPERGVYIQDGKKRIVR